MTRRGLIVAALALASVVFVGLELRDSWRDVSGEQLPGAGWIALAVVLLAVGQLASGEAMGALPAPPTDRGTRRRVFHLTQPAKYVPAGVAQAAGVVLSLVGRGATRSDSIVLWVVHTGSLVVAGVAVGLVASPALSWPLLAVVPGLLLPLTVSRPVLVPLFGRIGRMVGANEPVVPSATALGSCVLLTIVAVGLQGFGFATLVAGASLDVGVVEAAAAYTLAFGISVATPLPGGLGAREAIILGLLAASEAVLIVPIVLVRVLLIVIELVLLAAARLVPSGSVDPGARDAGAASAPPADPH